MPSSKRRERLSPTTVHPDCGSPVSDTLKARVCKASLSMYLVSRVRNEPEVNFTTKASVAFLSSTSGTSAMFSWTVAASICSADASTEGCRNTSLGSVASAASLAHGVPLSSIFTAVAASAAEVSPIALSELGSPSLLLAVAAAAMEIPSGARASCLSASEGGADTKAVTVIVGGDADGAAPSATAPSATASSASVTRSFETSSDDAWVDCASEAVASRLSSLAGGSSLALRNSNGSSTEGAPSAIASTPLASEGRSPCNCFFTMTTSVSWSLTTNSPPELKKTQVLSNALSSGGSLLRPLPLPPFFISRPA
mmetsp:Transcript_27461/g.69513  ORF Transcript_27461/g.69513 Transcript_27461/m.69513 type:complete len:312 (+) Transcript_27461:573-1508(+)